MMGSNWVQKKGEQVAEISGMPATEPKTMKPEPVSAPVDTQQQPPPKPEQPKEQQKPSSLIDRKAAEVTPPEVSYRGLSNRHAYAFGDGLYKLETPNDTNKFTKPMLVKLSKETLPDGQSIIIPNEQGPLQYKYHSPSNQVIRLTSSDRELKNGTKSRTLASGLT